MKDDNASINTDINTAKEHLDYQEVCTKSFTQELLQYELELRRKEVIKELIDLNYKEKNIKYQKLEMLKLISDQDKIKQLYDMIVKLHEGILEKDGSLDDILQQVLDSEDLEFFSANKHSTFKRSREVFDKYLEHPVQKKLLSTKSISVKELNATNTYNKHINCIHSAKQFLELKERLKQLEEANAIGEYQRAIDISAISSAIDSLARRVSNTEDVVKGVIDELTKMSASGVDPKKLLAYKTKMDNPKITNKQIGDLFGVDARTVIRWIKDIKKHNLSTTQG